MLIDVAHAEAGVASFDQSRTHVGGSAVALPWLCRGRLFVGVGVSVAVLFVGGSAVGASVGGSCACVGVAKSVKMTITKTKSACPHEGETRVLTRSVDFAACGAPSPSSRAVVVAFTFAFGAM